MRNIQMFAVILFLLVSVVYMPTVMAIGGGGNNPPWGGPMPPMCCFCDVNGTMYWEGVNPYLDNVVPDLYDWIGVEITDKGVLTCVNLTLPDNCTANVSFEWLNWTQYFDIWMTWAYAQDWDDWVNISWDTEPNWDNDSFWYNYSSWTNINQSTQLCEYAENVSCYTENDWASSRFDWRVNLDITCANSTYNATCYYCFTPEACPLSYIYPPSPNGTACPCCDAMCVRINNVNGHGMNITIYRNDSHFEEFYMINEYNNVTNNTYCFCIDGHINNSIYYPMRYNETYYWYVNITDVVTGEYTESDVFQFRTEESIDDCPCGEEAIRLATGRGEIIRFGSLHDLSSIAFILAIMALLAIIMIYHRHKGKESEESEIEEQDETGR